jgi:hypothetical protein
MYTGYSIWERRLYQEFVEEDAVAAVEKIVELAAHRRDENFYLVAGKAWVQYRWNPEENNVRVRQVEIGLRNANERVQRGEGMEGWVVQTEHWQTKEGHEALGHRAPLEQVSRSTTAKRTEIEAVAEAQRSESHYVKNGFERTQPGVVRRMRANGVVLEYRITVVSGRVFHDYPFG